MGARRVAAAALVAAGCSAFLHTATASACARTPYAYAGISGTTVASGISASISTLAAPRVSRGHVAAFVGVGGPGLGPNGSNEWLQIGLSGFAGGASSVYYEVARPGRTPLYTELKANVRPGETHWIAVLEMHARPNWWRVWLDGREASRPIYLPSSHGRWTPLATAESWTPAGATCNGYSYRFDRVSTATTPGGAWRALGDHYAFSDAGYRIVRRSTAQFVATNAAGTRPRRELVSVRR